MMEQVRAGVGKSLTPDQRGDSSSPVALLLQKTSPFTRACGVGASLLSFLCPLIQYPSPHSLIPCLSLSLFLLKAKLCDSF